MPWEGRGVRAGAAVVLPAGVQVSAAGDPQPVQPARDCPDRAGVPLDGQFVGDPARGAFVLPPPGIDQLDHLHRQPGGSGGRDAGVVF